MEESGRYHTGPPTAPRRMALAAFAADNASSVKGLPVLSIEHCSVLAIESNSNWKGICSHSAEQMFLKVKFYLSSTFLLNNF
jgi:hypothetical protein